MTTTKRLIVWPAAEVFEQKESAFNCVRIKSITTKQPAITVCREFVAAYKRVDGPSGFVYWEDLELAHTMAKNALKAVRHENRAAKLARDSRKASRA